MSRIAAFRDPGSAVPLRKEPPPPLRTGTAGPHLPLTAVSLRSTQARKCRFAPRGELTSLAFRGAFANLTPAVGHRTGLD